MPIVALVAAVGWLVFIFATSCTVVRPQEFFDWIHRHVFTSDSLFARFQTFWGVSWLVIVKGWHALEFAVLFRLCLLLLDLLWPTARVRGNIVISIAICMSFAVSDEWHQTFVPERGGVVSDVLIDWMGILATAWLMLSWRRIS